MHELESLRAGQEGTGTPRIVNWCDPWAGCQAATLEDEGVIRDQSVQVRARLASWCSDPLKVWRLHSVVACSRHAARHAEAVIMLDSEAPD